jgi:low temperature requirement protein LtrA
MVRARLHAPEAQAVTFVELFFDLVFVFAVTQVTALTAHNLTWAGVGRSLLLFWLIWWAWTQFTWTLNPADTDHTVVRVCTLVATATAFVMAASVTQAFGDDVLWFAVPYVVVRVLGLSLQLRIDLERDRSGPATVAVWVALSFVGLALVLAGAAVDPPLRNVLWLLAVFADLIAAARAAQRGHEWDIAPSHFTERHGLFVIIALGESLIVAATAVSADERTADLMTAVITALLVACLLWWTYFGWLKGGLERGLAATPPARLGAVARDAFSFGHFPLVCGIVGFAVALEAIVHHPGDVPDGAVVASLGAGIALFVGCSALAYWRTTGRLLVPRLVMLLITLAALAVVADRAPSWQLAVVAIGLAAIAAVERNGPAKASGSFVRDGDLPIRDGG